MRVVLLSDTHLRHWFNVPDGDVLIHAGDATMRGTMLETQEFCKWFESLPHKVKVFVPGNHDFAFQDKFEEAFKLLPLNCTYLEDSGGLIGGLNIWGSPWNPEFHNWAFQEPRGKALAEHWAKIPTRLDILITHSPPFGIGDEVRPPENNAGCRDMLAAIKRVRPKVHVFGHIHGSYGLYPREHTLHINASICNEAYEPVNAPVTLNLAGV